MSYPLAAFVAGALAERGFDRRYLTSFLAMAAGLAVVFASGVLWLGLHLGGVRAAVAAGFAPFVAVDLVKLAVAAAAMPAVWRFIGPRWC